MLKGVEGPERSLAFQALRQDAESLARLRHPNIVTVYDYLETEGQDPFLVFQYVEGDSLAGVLKKEGVLPWQRAARYIADVAEGLQEVHRLGLVHRDIKPEYILLEARTDEALLTDFGIATHLHIGTGPAGTPPYMSPEAFRGRVEPAMDVYSLAVTLFRLTTNQFPFPPQGALELVQTIERGLPQPDPRLAGIPEPLEQVLRAGLEAEAQRRPTLPDFLARLRGCLNQLWADSFPLARTTGGLVHVLISRCEGAAYRPVLTTHPKGAGLLRDMRKVPPAPEQAVVRTGERIRLEVESERAGCLVVFNVGPAGGFNLLFPESLARPGTVEANRPVLIGDIILTPPTGRERVVALWSQKPLPLRQEDLVSLAPREGGVSRPYQATRDMKRLHDSVEHLEPGSWEAAALELVHVEENFK